MSNCVRMFENLLISTLRLLIRFSGNSKGNTAIMFGICCIPLVASAGAAIDFTRALNLKHNLNAAIDAAALAAGSAVTLTTEQKIEYAKEVLEANFLESEHAHIDEPTFQVDDTTVIINVTGTLDTFLLGVVGIDQIPITTSNEVTLQSKKLEVVMVLDNTGSMSGSKISSLKSAAEDLVEILFEGDNAEDLVKVGLVPFAASVNIGSDKLGSGWMDVNAQSSTHGENFEAGTNLFTLYDDIDNKSWNGCVEARPEPYDTTDAVPSSGNGDSLFVPYFYPDEPDWSAANANGYWYPRNYLNDGFPSSNTDVEERQQDPDKYDGAWISGSGPHYLCSVPSILALTNDEDDVNDKIDDMVASGSTNIPTGLAWGWRVVSPDEPFSEGVDYDDEDVIKAIVLLTDGENWVGNLNNHNKAYYNAYGYVGNGRLGTTDSGDAKDELDTRTATLCENIKNEGITLYTLTFDLDNGPIKDIMQACATTPGHYYDASDSSALAESFNAIATDLSNLRLSK